MGLLNRSKTKKRKSINRKKLNFNILIIINKNIRGLAILRENALYIQTIFIG
jgi:hypothetical protein